MIGAFENAVRKHDADSNDFATLETSRFTIPVSVIVAAYDEEVVIESTVRSLLAFDYPEFEVVVVNDGSSDATLERLKAAFDLAPYEMFVRRIFTTQPVRGIYRSRDYPNLVVVDKENGGKADSWNAALNLARYRYVCGVDADTVFDPKALLMAMRVAINDPARIVGVTSQITTARDPESDPLGAGRATARRRRAARALSASRLHPRVPQQSPRLVEARLHALLARRLPDLAAGRPRGGRRLLDDVHLRGHRAHLPHPRALSP